MKGRHAQFLIFENSQRMRLDQIAFHNMQSYLTYRYIKLYVLIESTIYESLVKIQHFRHE